jgi:hypothetical protein
MVKIAISQAAFEAVARTLPLGQSRSLRPALSPRLRREPCGLRERYDVVRLQAQYGWDAKLADLLRALVADCPKTRASESIYERCSAVYERG